MYHLFTHAFFKALLFLGVRLGDPRDAPRAGHAQDGGPAQEDPGHLLDDDHRHHRADRLPGYTAGYFSKDAVIESAYVSHNPIAGYGFACTVVAALLTSLLFLAADLQDLPRQAAGHRHVMKHVARVAADDDARAALHARRRLAPGRHRRSTTYFLSEAGEHLLEVLIAEAGAHVIEEIHHVPLWVKWSPS
jgi:NADH-quinone oxidoreductase subunit L